MNLRHACLTMGAALLLALPVEATAQGRIICWTDEQGQRACGDRLPPEHARGEQQTLDAQGRVVQRRAREATAEELAAEAAAKARERRAAREREEAERFDRYLLQSYSSLRELEAMRDRRVELIDANIGLAQSARRGAHESLEQLQTRLERIEGAGNPAPERLLQQIQEAQTLLRDNDRRLERLAAEREQAETQFARELARYRELRASDEAAVPAE